MSKALSRRIRRIERLVEDMNPDAEKKLIDYLEGIEALLDDEELTHKQEEAINRVADRNKYAIENNTKDKGEY